MNNSAENRSFAKTAVSLLSEVYQSRKERNPAYSMNSFARDLGTSLSLLSRVFSGSRPVTVKFAMQISAVLDLSESDSKALIASVVENSSKSAKISKQVREKFQKDAKGSSSPEKGLLFTTLEIERFKAIASWYHLAILNITTLDHFNPDPRWISSQLGITRMEAVEAIERLIALGLLVESKGKLQRSQNSLYIKTQKSELAVRKFHEQMIAKASDQLKITSDQEFQSRLINGITFSCGSEHLETIKDKINALQDEILSITSHGKMESVYQMNVQFFSLTKNKTKENS